MLDTELSCNPCVQRIRLCYECKIIIVRKCEETQSIKWIIFNAAHGVWRSIGLIFTYSWNDIGHPLGPRTLTGHFANFKEIPKKFKALNF
jgi:hypothetical protein